MENQSLAIKINSRPSKIVSVTCKKITNPDGTTTARLEVGNKASFVQGTDENSTSSSAQCASDPSSDISSSSGTKESQDRSAGETTDSDSTSDRSQNSVRNHTQTPALEDPAKHRSSKRATASDTDAQAKFESSEASNQTATADAGESNPILPPLPALPDEKSDNNATSKTQQIVHKKSVLQAKYDQEQTTWSELYRNNAHYQGLIDAYCKERAAFMKWADTADLADDMERSEFKRRGNRLGTMLAVAFGYLDNHGKWNRGIFDAIEKGGAQYANWSVKANDLQQLPGILRSAAVLATTGVAAGLGAGVGGIPGAQIALAAINGVYLVAQAATFRYVPFWQAAGQSVDVARRAALGPKSQPTVINSKLISENGEPGKLWGVPFLKKRIHELKNIDAEKIRKRLKALKTQIAELQDAIDKKGGNFIGAHNRREAAEHLQNRQLLRKLQDAKEEFVLYLKLSNKKLVQNIHVRERNYHKLSVSRIRNATQNFELDAPQLDAQAVTAELQRLQRQLAIEEVFVELSHQHHQGNSRNYRNYWNILTSGFNLAGSVASLAGVAPVTAPIIQTGGLASQLIQVACYHFTHPRAAAYDFASLLTVQCKVIALTGIGNLNSPKGSFDSARLNGMFEGPLKRVVNSFNKVLEHDQAVYLAAILMTLAEPNGDMPQGSYQESAATFGALKSESARKSYINIATRTDENASRRKKAQQILTLYEKNKRNLALLAEGSLDPLLEEGPNNLPAPSRQILKGALLQSCSEDQGAELPPDAPNYIEVLAEIKGKTESLSDLASVNQAAQKIGQTFSRYIAGPAAPLAFKFSASLVHTIFYSPVGAAYNWRKTIIDATTAGTSTLSIFGSILALFVAYSYHENISTKELHRARDKDSGAPMPNSGVVNWGMFGGKRHKPSGFDTLAAESITAELMPIPVEYDLQTKFWSDVFEQINAPQFSQFLEYARIPAAHFDIQSAQQAYEVAEEHVKRLNNSNTKDGEIIIDIEPRESEETERSSSIHSVSQNDYAWDEDYDELYARTYIFPKITAEIATKLLKGLGAKIDDRRNLPSEIAYFPPGVWTTLYRARKHRNTNQIRDADVVMQRDCLALAKAIHEYAKLVENQILEKNARKLVETLRKLLQPVEEEVS